MKGRIVLSIILVFTISAMNITDGSSAPARSDPVISMVDVTSLTFNSTTIRWETDVPSDSTVLLSREMSDLITYHDGSLVTSHSVEIFDLVPDTRYFFQVRSSDAGGNTSTDDNGGSNYIFRTATSEKPVIEDGISIGPTTGDPFNMTMTASDDWGIENVSAWYSFNGGPNMSVKLHYSGMVWYTLLEVPSDAELFSYRFMCRDVEGNVAITPEREITVMDNDKPSIQDVLHSDRATTGDPFSVSAKFLDNIGIGSAYLRHWYGMGSGMSNASMRRVEGDNWTVDVEMADDPSQELRFKVAVSDTDGNWETTDTFSMRLIDNDPPLVDAGENITIQNNQTVRFNGSASSDNDRIVNMTWSFFYDNETVSLHSSLAGFRFDIPGIYNVTLTAVDNSSLSSWDNFTVTVEDTMPPEPVITGDLSVPAGEPLVLSALGSADNGRIVSYIWSFQDGENITVEGPILNRVFERWGFVEIDLTVVDEFGLSATTTVEAEMVDNEKPVARHQGDLEVPLGEVAVFNGSASTDNGKINVYYWTFEGEGDEVELFGEVVEYTFSGSGPHEVSLTVFDQSGNIGSSVFTVKVVNTGILKGFVFDTSGEPLEGVDVRVKDEKGEEHETVTDQEGFFSIEVPRGKVEYFIGGGDLDTIRGTVEIEAGEEKTLDLSDRPLEKGNEINIAVVAGLVVLVLIVGATAFLLFLKFRRGKEKEEKEKKEIEGEKESGSPVRHEMIPDEDLGEIPMFTRDPSPDDRRDPLKEEGSMVDDLFEE